MFAKNRSVTIIQIAILASAILFVGYATAADNTLKLPPATTVIILEASNGTQSYFDSKLSNVPAGYDVTNRTYFGWCIDVSTNMQRSPATHMVILYSSLSPPADLANENWSKVNYILNHKKGEARDIQEAIWCFINLNGEYYTQRSMALQLVEDAKANGANFEPKENQIAAVIAYPVYLTDPTEVQISVIEITIPESGGTPSPTPVPTFPYSSPAVTSSSTTPSASPAPTQSQPSQNSPIPSNSSQGSTAINLNEAIAIALLAALFVIITVYLILRRRKRK